MTNIIPINHTETKVFSRLAELAADKFHDLPPTDYFFHQAETMIEHDRQYEHMTSMSDTIGADMEDDYLIALNHIIQMAERDGTKLRVLDILQATEVSLCVEAAIAVAMVLGALAFVSGEWLTLLLPI